MTSSPTHAFTVNGRFHSEVLDTWRPTHEQIRRMVGLLDAKERFSLALWKIPEGVPFSHVDVDKDKSYIQAGGSAKRMTVEVRTVDNGTVRQEVIGRTSAEALTGDPKEEVPFGGGYGVRVYPNEVFEADEAGNLFVAYYETGDVPDGYTKRLIQL